MPVPISAWTASAWICCVPLKSETTRSSTWPAVATRRTWSWPMTRPASWTGGPRSAAPQHCRTGTSPTSAMTCYRHCSTAVSAKNKSPRCWWKTLAATSKPRNDWRTRSAPRDSVPRRPRVQSDCPGCGIDDQDQPLRELTRLLSRLRPFEAANDEIAKQRPTLVSIDEEARSHPQTDAGLNPATVFKIRELVDDDATIVGDVG